MDVFPPIEMELHYNLNEMNVAHIKNWLNELSWDLTMVVGDNGDVICTGHLRFCQLTYIEMVFNKVFFLNNEEVTSL